MASVLRWFVGSESFRLLQLFLAWFPILFAFLAINSSRQFWMDRRGIVTQRLEPTEDDVDLAHRRWPVLTVIIPVHNGADSVGRTIEDACHLAWPSLEIVVVDDGSTDGTGELVDRLAGEHPEVRVMHKTVNQGKSLALDDAIAVVSGGLILISDDDALLPPTTAVLLASQLAHHSDLAAVTANPRMLRTERLLEKLQAIEFSTTVSTQRRGHSAWGRIATISGVCTMFRTDALRSTGGFDVTQPAEDIEITWRLQCAGWRVGYEPMATIGTYPMPTLRRWFRQRRRWAAGLVRAIMANWRDVIRLRNFAMWPLLLEAIGSILWCHLLFFTVLVWIACLASGVPTTGDIPLVGEWGTMALCVTVFQILWGMHLDHDDDPTITGLGWYAPIFPLVYWWLLAATVVTSTLPALLMRRRPVRW